MIKLFCKQHTSLKNDRMRMNFYLISFLNVHKSMENPICHLKGPTQLNEVQITRKVVNIFPTNF